MGMKNQVPPWNDTISGERKQGAQVQHSLHASGTTGLLTLITRTTRSGSDLPIPCSLCFNVLSCSVRSGQGTTQKALFKRGPEPSKYISDKGENCVNMEHDFRLSCCRKR
jgi:hypothetical protein